MPNPRPHILLTNDDGIASPGLAALAGALDGLAALTIAAPSGERSGAAHSISVRRAVACEPAGAGRWSIDGTPTDAVIIALNHLFEDKPDLVISGINHGANAGQNIHYSGTVGAALEAALNGIPSFALSLATRNPHCDFAPAARLGAQLARLVIEESLPEGVLLNVNVPEGWKESERVRFTRQSRRITRNGVRKERGSGGPSFWIEEIAGPQPVEPDSDLAALRAGAVTITPMGLPGTHEPSLNHLSHLAARLESLLEGR